MAPEAISEKFADLSLFGEKIDSLPAEHRDKIGDIRFEKDAIVVKNPAVGELAFKVVERSPEKVVFRADGMLPLGLIIDLKGLDNNTATEVRTSLDVELPMMLRPLIGGKLQQVADGFGDFIAKLAQNN